MLSDVQVGSVPCSVVIQRIEILLGNDGAGVTTAEFGVHLAIQLPSGDTYPLTDPDAPMTLEDGEVPEHLAEGLLEVLSVRVRTLFGDDLSTRKAGSPFDSSEGGFVTPPDGDGDSGTYQLED